MRIGIITGEYPPMQGGVGDFSRELSKALATLGHTVHILTRTNCHQEGLPANCTLHPEIEQWNWSLGRRIRRWVKANRLQVVNIQYQAAAYNMHPAVNLLPGKLAGAPLVVTFHDLNVPYLFPKAGRLRWWSVLMLARRAGGVIITNREDQIQLEARRFIPRIAVIPIGSNIEPVPPAGYQRADWRKKWGVRPEETLLGYFGFLNASKGGEDLLEALYRLKKRGDLVKLMMIGGRTGSSDPTNQAYAEWIDTLVARMRLQERVLWTGYTSAEKVSANLLAADICILPYRDGVSFRRGSLMAALAHGRPIISTTPAVELPVLEHRQNMYLVPPAAPVALAEAVIAIRENTALQHRLAAGAKELAQAFRWDSIAQATVEFFDSW